MSLLRDGTFMLVGALAGPALIGLVKWASPIKWHENTAWLRKREAKANFKRVAACFEGIAEKREAILTVKGDYDDELAEALCEVDAELIEESRQSCTQ